jgi:hypothetical protein
MAPPSALVTAKTYASPGAFKAALEDRLRRESAGGLDIQRRRQIVVFTRMLARINAAFGDTTVLKGGFALELRLDVARTTRDIDLVLRGSDAELLERLQAAGQLDLDDYMTFEIQPDKDSPDITGDGVLYGGKRFRVECKLGGKVYGARFGLDVVLGGKMLGEPSPITTEPFLDFAGIAAPIVQVLPVETHLAEKLHAYTLPRTTENARVRDLPDMALLGTVKDTKLVPQRLREAFRLTFEARTTHELPATLPSPPLTWTAPYKELAAAHELPWSTLAEVTHAAKAFVDPILSDRDVAVWDPVAWAWS